MSSDGGVTIAQLHERLNSIDAGKHSKLTSTAVKNTTEATDTTKRRRKNSRAYKRIKQKKGRKNESNGTPKARGSGKRNTSTKENSTPQKTENNESVVPNGDYKQPKPKVLVSSKSNGIKSVQKRTPSSSSNDERMSSDQDEISMNGSEASGDYTMEEFDAFIELYKKYGSLIGENPSKIAETIFSKGKELTTAATISMEGAFMRSLSMRPDQEEEPEPEKAEPQTSPPVVAVTPPSTESSTPKPKRELAGSLRSSSSRPKKQRKKPSLASLIAREEESGGREGLIESEESESTASVEILDADKSRTFYFNNLHKLIDIGTPVRNAEDIVEYVDTATLLERVDTVVEKPMTNNKFKQMKKICEEIWRPNPYETFIKTLRQKAANNRPQYVFLVMDFSDQIFSSKISNVRRRLRLLQKLRVTHVIERVSKNLPISDHKYLALYVPSTGIWLESERTLDSYLLASETRVVLRQKPQTVAKECVEVYVAGQHFPQFIEFSPHTTSRGIIQALVKEKVANPEDYGLYFNNSQKWLDPDMTLYAYGIKHQEFLEFKPAEQNVDMEDSNARLMERYEVKSFYIKIRGIEQQSVITLQINQLTRVWELIKKAHAKINPSSFRNQYGICKMTNGEENYLDESAPLGYYKLEPLEVVFFKQKPEHISRENVTSFDTRPVTPKKRPRRSHSVDAKLAKKARRRNVSRSVILTKPISISKKQSRREMRMEEDKKSMTSPPVGSKKELYKEGPKSKKMHRRSSSTPGGRVTRSKSSNPALGGKTITHSADFTGAQSPRRRRSKPREVKKQFFKVFVPALKVTKVMKFKIVSKQHDIMRRVPALQDYDAHEIFFPTVHGGTVMGRKCTLACYYGDGREDLRSNDMIIIRRKSTKKSGIGSIGSFSKKSRKKSLKKTKV